MPTTTSTSTVAQFNYFLTPSEQWKTIDEFPAYSVSDQGRIKSNKTDKVMSLQDQNKGYVVVNLINEYGLKRVLVHRIVAKAFHPNPDNLPQVNHLNTDKTDNRAINVEWTTQSDNIKHAFSMGLMNQQGTNNSNSKLSEEAINYIRTYGFETSTKTLASRFQVSETTIKRLKRGETYQSVITPIPTYA